MSCIYVLQLENDCFYVGRTTDIVHRYKMHKNGTGATWTKVHKVVSILDLQEDAPYKELVTTLEYMKTHGVEKVRGGPWCTISLVSTEIDTIQQLLESEDFARVDRTEQRQSRSDSNKRVKLEPTSELRDVSIPVTTAVTTPVTTAVEIEDLTRQGMFWNNDEIALLIEELQSGTDMKEIAKEHKRTQAAIRARIGHIIRTLQSKGLTEPQIASHLNISDVHTYK